MRVLGPDPGSQASGIRTPERDPLGVGQAVVCVHAGHEVGDVGQGLLRGQVDQVLNAHVFSGVTLAVESETNKQVVFIFLFYSFYVRPSYSFAVYLRSHKMSLGVSIMT